MLLIILCDITRAIKLRSMRWQDHAAHIRRENTFRQKAQVSAGALKLRRADNIQWILEARGCEGADLLNPARNGVQGRTFVITLKMKVAGYSETTAVNPCLWDQRNTQSNVVPLYM